MTKKIEPNLEGKVTGYIVWRQDWEESERGWGIRPDGYSLHLSQSDVKAFVRQYWAGMPKEVPDEYSRESGSPYKMLVDKKTYDRVKNSGNGVWER